MFGYNMKVDLASSVPQRCLFGLDHVYLAKSFLKDLIITDVRSIGMKSFLLDVESRVMVLYTKFSITKGPNRSQLKPERQFCS